MLEDAGRAAPHRRPRVRGDGGRRRRGDGRSPRLVRVADEYEDWLARARAPSTRAAAARPATSSCSSTRRGRPASRRASSRRTATWPRAPRRRRYWQFDARHRLRDAAADVPHRRHRLDVPRPLERRDDDPRARVRARGGARPARARARDERDLRADDAADADGGTGRGRARLLGAAVDRLRRVADHDAGVEGGAADVPLLALRGLRADRDHGRRRAARSGGPRPGGPREHLLRSAGRPLPWVELRVVDPATGSNSPRRGRRGVAARAERDAGVLRAARRVRGRAHRRRLAAHGGRRLRRRGRATSSSPTGSRT